MQARIVMSDAERTDPELYDTVVGYRGGNWIFEWAKQAMIWQQKAGQEADPLSSAAPIGRMHPISIALPPTHILKVMSWRSRRRRWLIGPMKRRLFALPGELRELCFLCPAAPVTGFFTYAEKRRSVPGSPDVRRSGCAADGLLQPV